MLGRMKTPGLVDGIKAGVGFEVALGTDRDKCSSLGIQKDDTFLGRCGVGCLSAFGWKAVVAPLVIDDCKYPFTYASPAFAFTFT